MKDKFLVMASKKYLFWVSCFGFLSFSPLYANTVNSQLLEDGIASNKKVLAVKPKLIIPKFGRGGFGELENSTHKIKVKKVVLEYNQSPPKDLKRMLEDKISKLEQKEWQVKDIVKSVKRLEQDIVAFGYPIVVVLLPKQDLIQSGTDIRLQIVSGYVENINVDTSGVSESLDKKSVDIAVRNIMHSIKNQAYLSAVDINNRLVVLQKMYGTQNEIFLSRGQWTGGFIINVKTMAENSRIASINNNMSRGFGRNSVQLSYFKNYVNNGASRQTVLTFIGSLKQVSNSYYRLLDVNNSKLYTDGMERKFGASISTTSSSPSGSNYKLLGKNITVYGTIKKPLVLLYDTRKYVTFGVSMSRDSLKNSNTGQFQYVDRVQDASIAYEYQSNAQEFTATLTKGLTRKSGFGSDARSKADADQSATRLKLDYTNVFEVGKLGNMRLQLSGQTSFGKTLLSGQQFSATGKGRLRGMVDYGLTGDMGLVGSIRKNFSVIVTKNGLKIIPSIVVAAGRVSLAKPTAAERKNRSAQSVTVGMSTVVKGKYVNLEYSRFGTDKNGGPRVKGNMIEFSITAKF